MKARCEGCFKNLSIKSRLLMYKHITENQKANVGDLTKKTNLKQPTVSYHLGAMVKSGLLSKEIKGRNAYFVVNPTCPHDGTPCILK